MEKVYIWPRILLMQQQVMGHSKACYTLEEIAPPSSWPCTLAALMEPGKDQETIKIPVLINCLLNVNCY